MKSLKKSCRFFDVRISSDLATNSPASDRSDSDETKNSDTTEGINHSTSSVNMTLILFY